MRRREFVVGAGAGAAIVCGRASAQQVGRTYRIGFLIPTRREAAAITAFFDELKRNGFIEGENLVVYPGFAVPKEDLEKRAGELARLAPDVIVGGPDVPLRALRRETGTIPLIGMSEDLVAEGLVASLARPGGNVTGISLLSPELDGKRQELLVEAVSGVRHLVALGEAAATSPRHIEALREAAAARNVRFTFVGVARLADIQAGLRDAKAQGAAAVNVLASALLSVPGSSTAQRVIDAAAELRMPAMFQWPETAEQGGTLGYGARFTEVYRQRARLVVKVLLGARVADLPVEQPTNFELVINLKSAKAIGADISPSLLARADEVIE